MDNYRLKKEELFKKLESSGDGLTTKEAEIRQSRYGFNVLQESEKKSKLKIFLEQFRDFLVIILIIAAIISGVLGDFKSTIVIFAVITLNAILGTIQTVKAEQSLKGLEALTAPMAKVIRDNKLINISAKSVTVGDVIVVEAGDYICADGRIVSLASLKVDESALTGESVPVEKKEIDFDEEVSLGDRLNMVYAGSFVTYGRAYVMVTEIGMNTEMGKIASLLKATKNKQTPLQVSLDNFGKKLSIAILFICGVLFAISIFRGVEVVDAFVFSVALAVAAIPEALSSIITIMLSLGTRKLAKEKAVIRKLQAVEGLGSVSIICSDKTGTLTQNKMTVQKIFFDGEVLDAEDALSERQLQLVMDSVLCNDAVITSEGKEIGDPTETALLVFANKKGINIENLRTTYHRLDEIPFDSDRKLMTTVHKIGKNYKYLTKGAVDVMLPRIVELKTGTGKRSITKEDRCLLEEANQQFAENGLRVLAVCERESEEASVDLTKENDFVLLGLIAMQDPPRPEAKEAVSKCKMAGIKPIMITGDHLMTAKAIAKSLGIFEETSIAMEGADVEKMSDEQLDAVALNVAVYARVSPEHKIRIVDSLQRLGKIVAMTGDGVNDAPALKQADVGVAMGITGSEVAKDSAAMVLMDDNFATIVKAVEIGRNIYANIRRALEFLLSGNTAGILMVLYASLMALPIPFMAVHLLFINLLTDSLPAIALGLESGDSKVMKEKPRLKNSSILSKNVLLSILFNGIILAITTAIAYHIGLKANVHVARTMAFATLCLSRLVHGFNCKSDRPVLFTKSFFNNKALLGAFLVGIVLLNLVLFVPPLQGLFSVSALTVSQIVAVYGLSFSNLIFIQILKYCRNIASMV